MATNNIDPIPELDYEVFDRQFKNFCSMTKVMVAAWDDYSTQEMTFDIISLCTKASRLCFMADQDLVLQQSDVTQKRKIENNIALDAITALHNYHFTPLLRRIIHEFYQGKKIEGHKSPMIKSEMMTLFPKLTSLFVNDGMTGKEIKEMQETVTFCEKAIEKNKKATIFPGVRYEERFWYLMRIYIMICYLMLHFQKVCQITSHPINNEEAGRLTELAVQKFMTEEKTKNKLELYFANLQYDNDGKPLDEEQLLKARRELKNIVPESLQLAFLKNAGDTTLLGAAINKCRFTSDEFVELVEAETKYQMITERIYSLKYPEKATPKLPNEVFNTIINNRLVDMEEVKKTIAKMIPLIRQKNHWFCVWCVLKHLNLLRPDSTFAGFAHQMMSREWFGFLSDNLYFTGDNLSDYSRYFSEVDFMKWDRETFLQKKALFNMVKWSDKLYDKFSDLCKEMFYSTRGHQFLEEVK